MHHAVWVIKSLKSLLFELIQAAVELIRTAVENRLDGKRMFGLVGKHIESAYIQPLGGAKSQ